MNDTKNNTEKKICECSGKFDFYNQDKCQHSELQIIVIQKLRVLRNNIETIYENSKLINLKEPHFDTFQISTGHYQELSQYLKGMLEVIWGEDFGSGWNLEEKELKEKGGLLPLMDELFKKHEKVDE